MPPQVFQHPALSDYELLDSGEAWKLERYGAVVLARPDPQALWRRRCRAAEWERADLRFERESDRGGRWLARPGAQPPESWTVDVSGARFRLRPTPFKHLGLFPEQAANWALTAAIAAGLGPGSGPPRLLDLFGYTGVASVLAARAGFAVTHVEASRAAITWARENAALSGLGADALRLVHDDAPSFARRELRRGARYECILLDPPHYGRGPRGEKWQLESGLAPLLETCAGLLAERACLVLSIYAVGSSPLSLANLVAELGPGQVEVGELALPESSRAATGAPRLLPCGFSARFARGLSLPAQVFGCADGGRA